MKETLRQRLDSQIKEYLNRIEHYNKLIASYLAEENYSRCLYYKTKKDELASILKDLNSL